MQLTTLAGLEKNADAAARFLKLVANEKRMLILCQLARAGAMPVGALADAVDLSQSALSQHLRQLRDEGFVAFRRDGQTLHYSVADPRAVELLQTLKRIFCP